MTTNEPRLVETAGLIHRVRRPPGLPSVAGHAPPDMSRTVPGQAAVGAGGPFPTVVMLHGWSGDESVMWIFAEALPPGWLAVAPRGIGAEAGGKFIWTRDSRDHRRFESYASATESLAELIHNLPELYGADPARIFAMGFSQGAVAGYALALSHPGLLRGVAALAGFLPWEENPSSRPLAGLPVFACNGINDSLVPISAARATAQRLTAAGAEVTYVEEAVGHKVGREGMRALREWWGSAA